MIYIFDTSRTVGNHYQLSDCSVLAGYYLLVSNELLFSNGILFWDGHARVRKCRAEEQVACHSVSLHKGALEMPKVPQKARETGNNCPKPEKTKRHALFAPPKGPRWRGVSCGAINPLGGVRPAVEAGPRRGIGLEMGMGEVRWFWLDDLVGIYAELEGIYGDLVGIYCDLYIRYIPHCG